jgi:hypothetical protein
VGKFRKMHVFWDSDVPFWMAVGGGWEQWSVASCQWPVAASGFFLVVSGLSDYFPALNTGDFGVFGRGRGIDRRILRENGLFVVGILPGLRRSLNCIGSWGFGLGGGAEFD